MIFVLRNGGTTKGTLSNSEPSPANLALISPAEIVEKKP
jgi:hypothetical protein